MRVERERPIQIKAERAIRDLEKMSVAEVIENDYEV